MTIPKELMENTFIYNGKEVRLTSRTATKKKRSGDSNILYEVCPISVAKTSPTNTNFNYWVKLSDLAKVEGENELVKIAKIAVEPKT